MSSPTPVKQTDLSLPDTAEVQRQGDLTRIALRLEFERWPIEGECTDVVQRRRAGHEPSGSAAHEGARVGEYLQDPHNPPVSPIEVAQDSMARGRPGLRIATPAFNRAWRTVSGLTRNSSPIEAQESPDAYRETAR